MASRLASRLKPGSSNKKSPVPSQPSTPTHSQTNVNAKLEEPSVDDILAGPEIDSLRVDIDELNKIHDSVFQAAKNSITDRKRTQQVIVIRDSDDYNERNIKKKCVAVLYPLPPGVKPTKTKLLGSVHAGPRHDENDMFISHSILGPVDEFIQAEDKSATPFNVSQLPSTVFPKTPPSLSKRSSIKRRQMSRETNALLNWEKRMNERKQLQDHIRRRLQASGQLVMNRGDSYRQVQEQRGVIDRAIPSFDKGKGYHVGSEFWKLQPMVGDDQTGLRLTLTDTERGHPPDIEMVEVPQSIRKRQGMQSVSEPSCHSWNKSAYLKSRRNDLKDAISEMAFTPSKELSLIHVTGRSSAFGGLHGSGHVERAHTTSTTTFLNSGSLDSLGEGAENNGNETNSLLQSTSILDLHPDVVSTPVIGPALKLNDILLKWEGRSSPAHSLTPAAAAALMETSTVASGRDTTVRVLFETTVNRSVSSTVHLQNIGTTSLKYNWKRITRPNPLGTSLAGKTQRFYFDTKADVLSPGGSLPLKFVFKSSSPGLYTETWSLETTPTLCAGRPIILTLRGMAFKPDINKDRRGLIEDSLDQRVAEATATRLVDRIVDSIHTPPRIPSPIPYKEMEKDEFLRKNEKFQVFYHYDSVLMLKKLYMEIKCPSLAPVKPPASEVVTTTKGGAGNKKEEKSKKGGKDKKDGGGGKGGKGAAAAPPPPQPAAVPNPSHEEVKEHPIDQISPADIPPWDLSIGTLQQMIIDVEDDERREDLFARLSSTLSSLCLPPSKTSTTTRYATMYSILCETIDDISAYGVNLRKTMGLPPKDLGLKNEEDSTESENIQPTHSESPIHGGKKDQGGKKGKGKEKDTVKEKDRPSSKQKGKIQRKGSFKAIAKSNIAFSKSSSSPEPDKPVVEVDPILETKYKQSFHSMAHYILSASMQQVDDLLALTQHEKN